MGNIDCDNATFDIRRDIACCGLRSTNTAASTQIERTWEHPSGRRAERAPLRTPPAVVPAGVPADPSVYILKCEGKGSSAATLPSGEGFSDPDDEELYVKVDVGAKALQTWINNHWVDWCSAEDKCSGDYTKTKVKLHLTSTEHYRGETTNSTETFSFSALDGKFLHVDDEQKLTSGKFTLARRITYRGNCVKVDKPALDPSN